VTGLRKSRKAVYVAGAVAGFAAGAGLLLYTVFTSTSSTATIGLLFVPVYGVLGALVGGAAVHVVLAAADLAAGHIAWRSGSALAAVVLFAGGLLFGSAWLQQRHALAVAGNPQATPEMLQEISAAWIPLWRRDVDIALAKNPATPPALLAALVDSGDGHLVTLAGAHPGTPLPLLESIAAGPYDYERMSGLAKNPRITRPMAERLAAAGRGDFSGDAEYRLYQTYVLASLAGNPATPQDVFDRIAARKAPEYFLAVAIIYAKRSTCAQIARAGGTGSDVLHNTAQSQLRQRGC
jgi:hypothetical protein